MDLDEDFASAVVDESKIKQMLSNEELNEVSKPALFCYALLYYNLLS